MNEPMPPRRAIDPAALKQRREAMIAAALARAESELAAGRLDEAMSACVEAASIDDTRQDTIELTNRVSHAIDQREAEQARDEQRRRAVDAQLHLAVATAALERDALTDALEAVQRALASDPASAEGQSLLRLVQSRLEEQRQAAARMPAAIAADQPLALKADTRRNEINAMRPKAAVEAPPSPKTPAPDASPTRSELDQQLDAAEAAIRDENWPAALAAVDAAITLDPMHPRAYELQTQIEDARKKPAGRRQQAAPKPQPAAPTPQPAPKPAAQSPPPSHAAKPASPRPAPASVATPIVSPPKPRSSALPLITIAATILVAVAIGVATWRALTRTASSATTAPVIEETPPPATPEPSPIATSAAPPPEPATSDVGAAVAILPSAAALPVDAPKPIPPPAPRLTVSTPPPQAAPRVELPQGAAPTPSAAPTAATAPEPPPAVNPAADTLRRARALVADGSLRDAVDLLSNAGQQFPNDADVSSLLNQTQGDLRAAVRLALDNAAANEKGRNWPTALQQYERARQLDPTLANIAPAIENVNTMMRAEGASAFTSARQYDALDRTAEAIKWYDVAYRYLPDGDPNRRVAAERLTVLRARR